MRFLCLGVAVLCPLACDRPQQPLELQPLPENALNRSSGAELKPILLESARHFCTTHPVLNFVSDGAVAIGNMEAALNILDSARSFDQAAPVAIYATFGIDGLKRKYVGVWALNLNRETLRLTIIAHGPDRQVVRISAALPCREKALEFIDQHFTLAAFVTWDEITRSAEWTSDTRGQISVKEGDTVPIPMDVALAAGIEDRNGKKSNFVPVDRFDYP